MSELPPRSFAELREWEAGLGPGGLAGFVARTSRVAQHPELARRKDLWETRKEETDRKWREGAEAGRNKLDASQVRLVRMLQDSGMSLRAIGDRIGRPYETVQRIVNGETYKEVE